MSRLPSRLLLALGLLAIVVLNIVFTHNALTAPRPGHTDFLARWEGARSFWVDGLSPYSDAASLNIQRAIYGRPVVGTEDPNLFVYPFFVVFLLWPLVWLPYAWASAIWMVVLEACLLAALLLLLDLFRWRPRPLLLALLFLGTLAFYYSVRALMLGQLAVVVYLLEVLTLWALAKKRDGLAGIALALSLLKPQMGFLFVPLLLLWALRNRRWKLITSFGGTLALLGIASFIAEPSWLGAWLTQMRLYPAYTAASYPDMGAPVWIVVQHYLGLGGAAEWAVNLIFLALMGWAWWTVLVQGREERLLWAVMVTLTVTHLVALRTATAHFIVFIIPAIFYLKTLSQRNQLLAVLALLAALLLPWLHFLLTVQGNAEHPTLFLPPPFVMIVLLWLTRGRWFHAAQEMPSPAKSVILSPSPSHNEASF